MRRFALDSGAGRLADDGFRPRRILVAVDFGTPSLAAARWVARHLAPDAELVLVHVLPVPEAPTFLRRAIRPPDTFVRAVEGPMRHGLEGLAAELGASRVHVELRVGEPAEQLAAAAVATRAELICVGGPRRRRPTGGLGRNTVDRLLRRTTVPVLQAVGVLDGAPERILAAVDGGASSGPVLRAAWGLAARLEAQLTALHVIDEDVRAYVRAMEVAAGAAVDAPAAEEALWTATARWLGAKLEHAGTRPTRAHVLVGRGDPGHEILAAAERTGAALVVIGRGRHDAPAPNAVGDAARHVLRASSCPVLLVPDARVPVGPPGDGRRRPVTGAPARTVGVSSARLTPWSDGVGHGGDVPPAATRRPA